MYHARYVLYPYVICDRLITGGAVALQVEFRQRNALILWPLEVKLLFAAARARRGGLGLGQHSACALESLRRTHDLAAVEAGAERVIEKREVGV
jgi:hypothetical protein